jgi:hypothetical protein
MKPVTVPRPRAEVYDTTEATVRRGNQRAMERLAQRL